MSPARSIVLPCYNEAETLPLLFAGFREVTARDRQLEVVFVNNGSRDESADVFAKEMSKPEHAFARVVDVPDNQGYGHGILAGLKATRGEFIGWTHADSQYKPEIVAAGFDFLCSSADPHRTFLQGQRLQRPLIDNVFTAGMSVVASLLLGVQVDDVNAQPKLFPRCFLEELKHAPKDFSLDLFALVTAREKGYAVSRLPVEFGARNFGEAKGGGSLALKWKLTRRTWSFILDLRRRRRRSPQL